MPKYNDFDLKEWKKLDNINVDSLWIIERRKKDELNQNNYHGNFVPQIPEQFIQRYTKKGDIVLDPFIGSGTTAYEAIHYERKCIGIDLSNEMVDLVKNKTQHNVFIDIICGDSTDDETVSSVNQLLLSKYKADKVQLLVLHPPYHNIINFSSDPRDLSMCSSLEEFIDKFSLLVDKWLQVLEDERYVVLVIGDYYDKSEWVPLSSYCLIKLLEKGLVLKGTIIKNSSNTQAKQGKESIWRYRALAADYYLFKHEYIYVLKKPKRIKKK